MKFKTQRRISLTDRIIKQVTISKIVVGYICIVYQEGSATLRNNLP